MSRLVRTLAPWCFSLLVFVVGGEVVVRAFRVIDRMNGFPRRLYLPLDDPRLTYVMRPGADVVYRGYPVRINEQGMRGPSTTLAPQPGTHRILAVGDSSTFGEGVAVEDAWPSALERELAGRTHGKWEVLNSGVQGWNTEGELAYLETRGLAFAPEWVVVAFNLNDFDFMPVMGAHGILSLDRSQRVGTWSLANWSEFYMALRWFIREGRHEWVGDPSLATAPRPASDPFHPVDRFVSALRKQYYRLPTDERWPVMESALEGFGKIARKRAPPLFFVILPDGDQFTQTPPDLLPQQRILELCRRFEIECIDLYPAFLASGGVALFRDIMHPDADGYRIVARVVAERLLARPAAD